MSVDMGNISTDVLVPRDEWLCPRCGEQCLQDATWCDYFGDGRSAITPVHVRWTAEILDE